MKVVPLLLLAACGPGGDPDLAVREIPLGAPATTVFFFDDETLVAIADGTLYGIPVYGGPLEVLATDVATATPMADAGEMLIHGTDGRIQVLFPDGIVAPLVTVPSADPLLGADDGRLAVWNDQNLSVFVMDPATKVVAQLGISGHILGLSDDADQILVADTAYENWYLVYLSDTHLVPVRYPSSPEIVDIELVARAPRYAEVFSAGDPAELVVADGDGNVPMDAFMAGEWVAGAFVPDGSAVLTLEYDGDDALFVEYTWEFGRGQVHGRGTLKARPTGPASASPDGRRLAIGSPDGVTVFYQPSSG